MSNMSFTGKYKCQSLENYEHFMKAMGMPDDLIEEKRKVDFKTIHEIEQDGKTFKYSLRSDSGDLTNEFTIGEEAELDITTDEKVKTIVHMEGNNKLVMDINGGELVTELCGDTLTSTMLIGDISFKRTSIRI
ncbi:fatty acid-binding protein 1, liver-like [Rhinatrema bivittatum]|uniref:fatty acid-binding protein 1, liver-like n=1 Tax=Rhinatrema bivittatum TaxID=194408 RepID=UPI0011276DA2|nr:fatty acid-binding protein 1, liver-like [Rhinatrema bivittatum]